MEAKNKLPWGISWPDDKSYQWFAVDLNGKGYFYQNEPCTLTMSWYAEKQVIFAGFFPKLADNWQSSLIQRPENA